jgi:hypothetical protein
VPALADATGADEGPSFSIRARGDRLGLLVSGGLGLVVAGVLAWPLLFRPFWYDEAWRAYHVTITTGWWSALRSANAPMAAGWLAVERAASTLLGNREAALRLPAFASLPVLGIATYRLARYWLPTPWSTLAAASTVLNGSLAFYGLQLKAFLPEAAGAAVALCAWLDGRDAVASGRSARWHYVVLAICVVVALPVVFLVVPMLVVDAVEWMRDRRPRFPFAPVALAAVVTAHTLLFVRRQSYLAHDAYWSDFMLTGGPAAVVRRIGSALRSFPTDFATAGATAGDRRNGPFLDSPLIRPPFAPLHAFVSGGLAIAWVAGAAVLSRCRRGRAMLVVLGGCGLGIVAASLHRDWPVGFVRPNEFLVPLLAVVAVVGVAGALRLAATAKPAPVVVTVASVWLAALLAVGIWRVDQVRTARDPLALGDIRAAVEYEARWARPGDVFVVVTGHADVAQWTKAHSYYAFLADRTRLPRPLGEANQLGTDRWDGRRVARFVRSHPAPHHLFLVVYRGRDVERAHRGGTALLGRVGLCPVASRAFDKPARVVVFGRCAAGAANAPT